MLPGETSRYPRIDSFRIEYLKEMVVRSQSMEFKKMMF
jgi:hypothetical protein